MSHDRTVQQTPPRNRGLRQQVIDQVARDGAPSEASKALFIRGRLRFRDYESAVRAGRLRYRGTVVVGST